LRLRYFNVDRATENSVQARRAERPSSRPYATCCRRAGTLTINGMARPVLLPQSEALSMEEQI
jgi:hypothetical protein